MVVSLGITIPNQKNGIAEQPREVSLDTSLVMCNILLTLLIIYFSVNTANSSVE